MQRVLKQVVGFEWISDLGSNDDGASGVASEVTSTVFLTSASQRALDELYHWWRMYDTGRTAEHGYAPLWHLFEQIDEIRYWNAADRLGQSDVRAYFREQLDAQLDTITFEMQLWYRASDIKRSWIEHHWTSIVHDHGGEIISRSCLPQIRYHALLVRLPRIFIEVMVSDPEASFISNDWTVQLLQDVGQPVDTPLDAVSEGDIGMSGTEMFISKPPISAVFDTLPAANHPILSRFIRVEDPDDWSAVVPVRDRVHGTSMASLVIYGDLRSGLDPIDRQIVSVPILKPAYGVGEAFPEDRLMVDLIHERVVGLMEGPDGRGIRVINLAIGDARNRLARQVSKIATIVDYLSARYQILFVISAGNHDCSFEIPSGRDFRLLSDDELVAASLTSTLSARPSRRIIAPADSLNAITVGSSYDDASVEPVRTNLRIMTTESAYPAPYSREGSGFRRSFKPDIAAAGGRVAFMEGIPTNTARPAFNAPPGQLVAHPDGKYANTRGTSNSAAIITHYANIAASILDELRIDHGYEIAPKYEAVLIKALLVHAARNKPVIEALKRHGANEASATEIAALTTGYGVFDRDSFARCSSNRAILIGFGSLFEDEAHDYVIPIPSQLAVTTAVRRLFVTLAYFSPITVADQLYRRVKISMRVDAAHLRNIVGVGPSAFDRDIAARGTVQHLAFEGTLATASNREGLPLNVGCRTDAGTPTGNRTNYALLVTLEVDADADISVYDMIASALRVPAETAVPIRAPR